MAAERDRKLVDAVSRNDTPSLRKLIARGIPIDTLYEEGKTLLHIAAECGAHDVIPLLCRKNPILTDYPNDKGQTPLHIVAYTRYTHATFALILAGANPNLLDNSNEETALHKAIANRNFQIARILCCAKHIDVTICDRQGLTAIDLAQQQGETTLIEILHKKQAGEAKLSGAAAEIANLTCDKDTDADRPNATLGQPTITPTSAPTHPHTFK